MNATNWPAFNVWLFIAQMVEHCSVLQRLNVEAMGSNPVEVPNFFFLVNLQLQLRQSYLHLNLYFRSSYHLCVSFLSRVKMNSTNWPPPNIWVFVAQSLEQCSANAEAKGDRIPLKSCNVFRVNFQLLKLQLPVRRSYLHLN